jgi:hypothetical protein
MAMVEKGRHPSALRPSLHAISTIAQNAAAPAAPFAAVHRKGPRHGTTWGYWEAAPGHQVQAGQGFKTFVKPPSNQQPV